jgi:hypothetical protein
LAVVVVVVADWLVVVAGVVAATLWLELDEADPHALTISVSRTAASAMRRYLMADSLTPRIWWLAFKDANLPALLPATSPDLNRR